MESLVGRYDAIRPHLSERQRRLWLGVEARELGKSGVRIVAQAVQVSPDTVRRGRVLTDTQSAHQGVTEGVDGPCRPLGALML